MLGLTGVDGHGNERWGLSFVSYVVGWDFWFLFQGGGKVGGCDAWEGVGEGSERGKIDTWMGWLG